MHRMFRRFAFVALWLGVLGACGSEATDAPRNEAGTPEARSDAGPGRADADARAPDAGRPDGSTDTPDAGETPDASADGRTHIRVHYAGNPGTLSLRGSVAPLAWDASAALEQVEPGVYEWASADPTTSFEWKPMLDATWSLGPNYVAKPGTTIDVAPHFTQVAGEFTRRWPNFVSTQLPRARGIWVYLPPTYLENTAARFDVLYMHDGANLFSPATAYGGVEWQVDETMNAGASTGAIRETIVVGIESTSERIYELTPSVDPGRNAGGGANEYLAMVRTEIMPKVNGELRTLTGPGHTGVMGSSLGGLVSVYAAVHQADVFGVVGAMSPSTWWDGRMILGEVAGMPAERPRRIYVDSGDSGVEQDDRANTALLDQALVTAGYVEGESLKYVVQSGAEHNERYWAERLPGALRFLLGAREHTAAAP